MKKSSSRNFLNLTQQIIILEWLRGQTDDKFEDRDKAAKAATKILGFSITTFNLRTIERASPGSVTRVYKRQPVIRTVKKTVAGSDFEARFESLVERVEKLEKLDKLVSRMFSDLYGKN